MKSKITNHIKVFKLRIMPYIRHYSHILNITIGTIIFGIFLIMNDQNVIQRVSMFPESFSNIIGSLMIGLGVIKTYLTLANKRKYKKYILIAITLCWLTIVWSYLINHTQNTGSVMALIITVGCYLELWRGEYVG